MAPASRVGDFVDVLGEGPVWDDREQCAYTVDIVGRRVYRHDGAGLSVRTVVYEADRAVTCVLPASDGGLLIVERDRLVTRSVGGVVHAGPALLHDPSRRFNDGICDPQGRLLIGTLDERGVSDAEVLLRIDPSGEVEEIVGGLTLSNGLGFSPSGALLYHVDTMRQRVTAYDYTASIPVLVRSFVVEPGYPDGLAVDSDGFVWVAVWDGSEVRRYSPQGVLVGRLPLPTRQVTAPAFVGADLDELLITTAVDGIDSPGPSDGAVYLAKVGARGRACHRWAGSTTE